jgi:capsular exopolysaccharide synthesis family protein
MEEIREAVERARALNPSDSRQRAQRDASALGRIETGRAATARLSPQGYLDTAEEIELDLRHLQSSRIIAHNFLDAQSIAFDMLRTQVLQSMDAKHWRSIGITSPTPGCGKTLTAVNLAMSAARLPDRSVLLLDLDLRKPTIAKVLGFKPSRGVLSVMENRSHLSDAIIQARIGDYRLRVLPTEYRASTPSDRMASSAMSGMLRQLKQDYQSETIIVDLPPLLSSDDGLAVLPQLDCVLLVTAVETTTVAQVKEASNHLHSTEVVKVVLNKVPRSNSTYYYYD